MGGVVGEDDVPDPLEAENAATVASALGLPGFAADATGTDIVVLAATFGVVDDGTDHRPRTAFDAAEFVASSILWHLWPKMTGDEGFQRMNFHVFVDGAELEIPHPLDVPETAPFVEALTAIRNGECTEYRRTVAPRLAGVLAIDVAPAGVPSTRRIVTSAMPFEPPLRHVARMRQAELVVDYLQGPIQPNQSLQWAGVFKASEDADAFFALAEPPTHDTWSEKSLTGTAKGVVGGARRFIQKELESRFALRAPTAATGVRGLSALASRLGGILPVRQDDDRNPQSGKPSSGQSRSSGNPTIIEAPRLAIGPTGDPYIAARIRLPNRTALTTYRAEASVVLEGGGAESAPPNGALVPSIQLWTPVDQTSPSVFSSEVTRDVGAPEEWWVYSTFVPDAVIRMTVAKVATHGE